MSAELHQGEGLLMVDHVAAADISAGDMVLVGSDVLIAHRDIASGATGALAFPGGNATYRVTLKAGAIFSAGDDCNIDPSTGEADPLNANKMGIIVADVDQTAGDTHAVAVHIS